MVSSLSKAQILMKAQPQAVTPVPLVTNQWPLVRNLQPVWALSLLVVMIFKPMTERNILKLRTRIVHMPEVLMILMRQSLRVQEKRNQQIKWFPSLRLLKNITNQQEANWIVPIVLATVKMGLRLSVCRPILRRHQGWLSVRTLLLEKVPLVLQPSVLVHPYQRMQRQQQPSVWDRKHKVIMRLLQVRLLVQKKQLWLLVTDPMRKNPLLLQVIMLRPQKPPLQQVNWQKLKKQQILRSVKVPLLLVNKVPLLWVLVHRHKVILPS